MITHHPRPRRAFLLAALLLALAAVAYSSWVLEIALPTRLSSVEGFASELFAADQPYRWVFGGLDIAAGLCAVAAGVLVLRCVAGAVPGVRWAYLGWGALVVFGVATVLDVVFPLDCAPSLELCQALQEAGRVSWRHQVHVVTSVLANVAALAAILALWLAARVGRVRPVPFRRLGAVLFWGAAVVALVTAALSLHDIDIDVPGLPSGGQGVPQRVQVGILAVWLGVAAASLRRDARAGRDDGGRGPAGPELSSAGSRRTRGRTWQAEADGRPVSSSRSTGSSFTSSGTDTGVDERAGRRW